ncbi:MAG: hypothetical protein V4687_16020 [Bacteroidota bacterium]
MSVTIAEYIASQKDRFEKLQNGEALEIAVRDTHAKQVQRIFVDGKNSDDSQIGKYNTTDPIYVNPGKAPKNTPVRGKYGQSTFSNGNKHKTSYFESYSEFRQEQGREATFVNLNLFGNLRSAWANGLFKVSEREWVVAIPFSEYVKVEGNEERFGGKISALTKEEHNNFIEVIQEESK